ncbi:hypothetical protein [Algoriphagus boritolerans]|uniref:Uncharacterized protein n=1 Tax=Algoriphagus boritolerans DSM 17298 = JCM 18970 TaxID=1120964 RepID=A0A1H5RV99_9BACT|nr:hypothetical protein [Algoriphagus boritolerans]SEF42190.1 hypothetical protein SAMN03080598_00132 [Algoriphagus boritolerans DSM 17298 = JCM 18970]
MKPLKSNPTQTVLVICTCLVLVYFIFDLRWVLYLAFGLGLLSILSTWISKNVEWVWFKLTYLLGLIVPNILLGVIFFLFLTPIAFLASLFAKKDSFLLKKPNDSAYQVINKKYSAADLENPW